MTPPSLGSTPSLDQLFEQLPDAVYLLDPATSQVLWCNRLAWEGLGLTPQEVLHHSVLSLQMDVTGLPQWSEIAEVIRTSRRYTFVGRHRHALGHEVPVEVSTSAFHWAGQEYFLSAARDISRRVALEGDLNTREKQLWFALNEASDGLWDWNVLTSEVFFSPQLKRILGYGPDEMHPTLDTWTDNVHPEDAPRVLARLREHLEGRRQRYEAEYRLRCRNGNYRWVEDRGRVCERDTHGQPTRVVGMVQDVSARHEAQEELRRHREHLEELVQERTSALSDAKAAAEAANRAKSRFLANMSHELRTPLAGVIGLSSLALEETREPRLLDRLSKIEQASQHLLSLINDILDLSKIEAERMVLAAEPLTLGSVLDSVSHLSAHRAQAKGLTLQVALAPDLAQRPLIGDALRLKQILLNLVDNAIKFTDQGSVRVSLQEATPVDPALLSLRGDVTDSGMGIAPEVCPRLFQPFEQADSSTTRRHGGTGLGLAISRQLVRMMGGDMGLESAPGHGTRVWFTLQLPLATRPTPHPPQTRAPGAELLALRQQHAGARVLLVEDDPVSAEVCAALLRQAGLVPSLALDGQDAIEQAAHTPVDLVLMDMQMPRMGGLEATRHLRAMAGGLRLPIIALTANAFEDDQQRCLAAGMDDYLTKPVDATRLYAVLLTQLQRTLA
ncbi:PAS domain-containing protein [Ideonella sp. B7]|uniref:PAS domain-containing protein n=1 Tax=Ideonella benzenivorans TaxID=2831643 RepID=UPI001CED37A0|nr:PAS domain-containing protein [Ideonella benzenivorans]MCA6215032.1 PAS domain-containing protein [Ideonella benzenivorans]